MMHQYLDLLSPTLQNKYRNPTFLNEAKIVFVKVESFEQSYLDELRISIGR